MRRCGSVDASPRIGGCRAAVRWMPHRVSADAALRFGGCFTAYRRMPRCGSVDASPRNKIEILLTL